MTYTTALIMEWLSSILWPLARVSSLLMVMAAAASLLRGYGWGWLWPSPF